MLFRRRRRPSRLHPDLTNLLEELSTTLGALVISCLVPSTSKAGVWKTMFFKLHELLMVQAQHFECVVP